MSERIKIIKSFYDKIDEDSRLCKSRHGQMEYVTTMHYIHRFAQPNSKILEIGAGTGKYSITLANEGHNVTALELVEHNLAVLKKNGSGLKNLQALQGDALDLSRFNNAEFDVTLLFGPMYHLYDKKDIHKALDEAIRVTKENGVILTAFLSVYAIVFNNYLDGNFITGIKENFTDDYTVKHFEEQLFTGYDIVEFENLFADKNVEHILTAAEDGILEFAEGRKDFVMTDEEFNAFTKYHSAICEKRELLGCSSHLLHICRKKLG